MDRVVRIGALNIVNHPHNAEGYQDLIRLVHNRRKAARVRSDRFGMISLPTFAENPKRADAFTEGLVGTFTKIDANSDWINIRTGQKAEEEDRQALQNLPRNLQPNHAQNRFRFYLRSHTLFFEIGNSGHKLTPNNAEALFKRLFSAQSVIDRYGDIDVTIMPNKDTLNTILKSKTIRSLRILVKKPNPDRGAEAERQFMARLERLNVRRVDSTYVADRQAAIAPDVELRDEARIASKNGRVDAVLLHEGRRHTVSTVDTPFVYTHEYDDRGTPEWDAFAHACESARDQLNEDG